MALKGIKVGSKSLILPPDIALRFELVNSAFDFETIPAGLVWTLQLPVKGNAEVLNFAHFIETKNKSRIYDATVIIGSNEVKGKLVILKTGNIVYEGSFIVNGFPVDALNKSLKEVVTGKVSFINPTISDTLINHANYCVTKTYPEVKYNFVPYKNTQFYGTENPTVGEIINQWDMFAQTFKRNDIGNPNYNEFSISPWLYLPFVIEKVFNSLGQTVKGNLMQHPQIRRMLLYNNYALDRVNDIFRGSYNGPDVPIVLAYGGNAIVPIDDDTTPPNTDPENLFNTITHEFTLDEAGEYAITCNINASTTFGNPADLSIELWIDGVFFDGVVNDPYNLQPFTIPVWAIGKKLTLRLFGLGGPVSLNLHSATFIVLKGYHPLLNVFAKEIDYANHVPDVPVTDFIIALRKLPGIKIEYNPGENVVYLDFNQDIFNAAVDDLTAKAAKNYRTDTNAGNGFTLGFDFEGDQLLENNFPDLSQLKKVGEYPSYADLPTPTGVGYYALVLNTNKIYKVVYNGPDLEWEFLCDNYYDYVIGDGKTEIRTKFSPMFMVIGNLNGGKGIIPHIEQTGSTPSFSTGINNFPLKIAIWHGLRPGFGGDFPLASSQNRDFNGDVIGPLTLRHDDMQYGIYVTFFKKWIDFMLNTESIIRTFKLNINEVFGNIFSRKKTVRHVENVFKKVTVDVTTTQISESEVEHCKIL